MQLVRAVFERIYSEMRVPTVEGRRHLRYMIAHWVTTRLPDGRGGVSMAMDPVVPMDNADVIDVLDPTCRLSDWLSDPSAPAEGASTASGNTHTSEMRPQDFAGVSEDIVRRWLDNQSKTLDVQVRLQKDRLESAHRLQKDRLEFEERQQQARLEEARINKEPDRLRAEAELERVRRTADGVRPVADRPDAAEDAPAAKRPCRRPPVETLDDLRQYRERHSVGHAAHDRLAAAVPAGADPPDLRRVCTLVAAWLTAQTARRARKLDVLTRSHGDVVLVYAFLPPHPRGYAPEAALLDHLRRRLWPDAVAGSAAAAAPPAPVAPATADASSDASSSSSEEEEDEDRGSAAAATDDPDAAPPAPVVRRVADLFLPPTPVATPDELAPVPLERQRRDIERIAALVGGSAADWPGGPAVMPPVPRDACRRWVRLPETAVLRPSELLRSAGWDRPTNYLAVTLVASRLEGWQRWRTAPGGYPKAAADCFRRAAWLLRAVTFSEEMVRRLQHQQPPHAGGPARRTA